MGADGLSCQPPSSLDPPEPNNHEDWLDHAYSFLMELLNDSIIKKSTVKTISTTTDQPLSFLAFVQVFKPTNLNVHIPQSLRVQARDECILDYWEFLMTHTWPPGLSDAKFESFTGLAMWFFLFNRTLWCYNSHSWHKLFVAKAKQYQLIKEAHDDLGHKGVLTIEGLCYDPCFVSCICSYYSNNVLL